jgi:hypothetical protein
MSEILQRRFRVLLHKAGKSYGWSSGNSRQSLDSDCIKIWESWHFLQYWDSQNQQVERFLD